MNVRDYRETGAVVSGDMAVMLSDHPEAFDAFLFRSISGSEENATEVTDVVGSLESSEVRIEYADPVAVRALLVPDENAIFGAFSDGTGENPIVEANPLVLLLSEAVVPRQSVVRWIEYTGQGATETREIAAYILKSVPYGKAPVFGLKHYAIPLISAGETGD